MSRLSIFSFESLRLAKPDLLRLVAAVTVALGVVASAEAFVRLDPSPKALPFSSTDLGTLFDSLLRHPLPFDFFFIGSSQCKCNVSPAAFEEAWRQRTGETVRAMNGGINGADPSSLREIYEPLGKMLKIKTLVILLSPDGLYSGAARQLTQSYAMDYLTGRLPRVEQGLMHLHLFRYRRQFRDLAYQHDVLTEGSLRGDLRLRLGPHGKGWHPTTERFGTLGMENFETVTRRELPRESSFFPPAIQDLEKTIRTAQARGRRVVLVVPPHPPRYEEIAGGHGTMFYDGEKVVAVLPPYPPGHVERAVGSAAMWSQFDQILRGLAERTGVVVVDHHRLPQFQDEQFADYHHLYREAARDYSRVLAQALFAATHQQGKKPSREIRNDDAPAEMP